MRFILIFLLMSPLSLIGGKRPRSEPTQLSLSDVCATHPELFGRMMSMLDTELALKAFPCSFEGKCYRSAVCEKGFSQSLYGMRQVSKLFSDNIPPAIAPVQLAPSEFSTSKWLINVTKNKVQQSIFPLFYLHSGFRKDHLLPNFLIRPENYKSIVRYLNYREEDSSNVENNYGQFIDSVFEDFIADDLEILMIERDQTSIEVLKNKKLSKFLLHSLVKSLYEYFVTIYGQKPEGLQSEYLLQSSFEENRNFCFLTYHLDFIMYGMSVFWNSLVIQGSDGSLNIDDFSSIDEVLVGNTNSDAPSPYDEGFYSDLVGVLNGINDYRQGGLELNLPASFHLDQASSILQALHPNFIEKEDGCLESHAVSQLRIIIESEERVSAASSTSRIFEDFDYINENFKKPEEVILILTLKILSLFKENALIDRLHSCNQELFDQNQAPLFNVYNN